MIRTFHSSQQALTIVTETESAHQSTIWRDTIHTLMLITHCIFCSSWVFIGCIQNVYYVNFAIQMPHKHRVMQCTSSRISLTFIAKHLLISRMLQISFTVISSYDPHCERQSKLFRGMRFFHVLILHTKSARQAIDRTKQ